jgi:hypothetical protein
MACRKQEVSVQQLQLVVLQCAQVSPVRRLMNLAGTLARRMRNPLASLRWELAKRRLPRKSNLPQQESACKEGAVALAGF